MYELEHGTPEIDQKYYFSFHTDDSFEPITSEPQIRPPKPDCIPLLDFKGFPEYETTTDEENESQEDQSSSQHEEIVVQNEEQNYLASMQYINEFYQKYHKSPTNSDQYTEDAFDD